MGIPVSQAGLVAAVSCTVAAFPLLLWIVQAVRFRRLQTASFLRRQQCLRNKLADSTRSKRHVAPVHDSRWSGYRHFIIESVIRETPSTSSVYLTATDNKSLANFLPGQFLTIRFNIPGCKRPVVRCYSLSDSSEKPYYRISVKRVAAPADQNDFPPGRVSNYVNDGLSAGQILEVKAPSGDFFLDESSHRPLILLAAGIGITPMMSIVEHLAAIGSKRLIVLLYGVVNSADHPFRHRLQVLTTNCPNLHVLNCYSQPQPTDVQGRDFQIRGRVSVELLKKLLPSTAAEQKSNSISNADVVRESSEHWKPIDCDYYLCGPGPFMETIYQDLLRINVDPQLIHFEAFGPASVKAIAGSSPNPASQSPGGESKIDSETIEAEVRFVKSEIFTKWQGRDGGGGSANLLETAESLGIEVDSGCRAGNCGACAVGLLSGEVEYPTGNPADCPPGHCLICIARPKHNSIVELEA